MAYLVVWMCVYMVAIDQARLGRREKIRGEARQREFLGISWCDGGCYLEPTWFFWESAVFDEVVLKRGECVEIMKTDDE